MSFILICAKSSKYYFNHRHDDDANGHTGNDNAVLFTLQPCAAPIALFSWPIRSHRAATTGISAHLRAILIAILIFPITQVEFPIGCRQHHEATTTITGTPKQPPWPPPPPPWWTPLLPFHRSSSTLNPNSDGDTLVQVAEVLNPSFWYCPVTTMILLAPDQPHQPGSIQLGNPLSSCLHQPSTSNLEQYGRPIQRTRTLYWLGKLSGCLQSGASQGLEFDCHQFISLILVQITPLFPPLSCSTMTTQPSRKAPSSLLAATQASSARTRSSSGLKAKLVGQDDGSPNNAAPTNVPAEDISSKSFGDSAPKPSNIGLPRPTVGSLLEAADGRKLAAPTTSMPTRVAVQ